MSGGINVFAQDHNGFLWLGDQSGLVRWDGYRIRRYSPDTGRADSLPDAYILSLHVDLKGRLWIGTSAGGLARYDPQRDNFHVYGGGAAGLSDTRVSALCSDGAGGLLVGTGAGVDHIAKDGSLRRAAAGAPGISAAALPEGGVEALLRDRSGTLWIGTRHGLLRRAPGSTSLRPVPLAPQEGKAPYISSLFQDSAGRIWIGTRTNGAFVIEAGGTLPAPVRGNGSDSGLANERVFSIAEAAPDAIWMGTEGGGIVVVDPQRQTTRRIRHRTGVDDSLHDDEVQAIYRERSGLMFVASTQGMSSHNPQTPAFLTVAEAGADSPAPLSIPSLLVRPDGRTWLGISGGGVRILDPVLGAVGHLRAGQDGTDNSLPRGSVISMVNGPDGMVYLGTQQGLFRSDGEGRRVERVHIPQRSAGDSIWALAYRDGILWAGGLDGLWALSIQRTGAPLVLRRESASLGDTRVTAIRPAPDGSVWVGTRAGLARLRSAEGAVERMPTHESDPTRLPRGYVTSLLIDRSSRLWVAYFNTGIVLLEGRRDDGSPRVRRIGTAQGLANAGVNTLLEDDSGMIWASTDDGLAQINPRTLALRTLRAAEGVHVTTYWSGSGMRGAAGELLFGGLSGLTVVRPDKLVEWQYRPPVVVTQIALNDKEIPAGRYNGAAAPGSIDILPAGRERGFALEFAALDYSAPERNQYSYRLAGFDADWIAADATSRRVSYTNLPAGSYTLQLRGSNRDGMPATPLDVPVRVLPAWHQHDWVRILAVTLALGLLWWLVQVRTAFLRRRQHELEAMVDARTAELRETQLQLEKLAYADPLTGLPNRRVFNDELRRLAAQSTRGGADFTLLLIDLDRFKYVNDTMGHDAGDALLVAAATRLKLAVRAADRVARLGGDEFAVLLIDTSDLQVIDVICGRIVDSLAEAIPYGADAIEISASIGGAIFTLQAPNLDALYKGADMALYDAKHAGRNTWRIC